MRVHLTAVVALLTAATLFSQERPSSPGTGVLRGRVDIRRGAVVVQRRPAVAGLGGPATRRPAGDAPVEERPAIVYLSARAGEAPLRAETPAQSGRARIDQRDETFLPHVLSIAAGTTVDFPNNDKTFHNVFSLSKVRRFDLGRYGRGKSESVTFDRPGVVRVFCDIHSHMSAFVLVFEHPFHTATDGDGRYRIENIPAGSYIASAWHEGAVRDTRAITIPPGGGIVDLDLLVR